MPTTNFCSTASLEEKPQGKTQRNIQNYLAIVG